MYQLLVLSVLNSVVASGAVDVGEAVATSYAMKSDGQPRGFDYSEKSGYNKVVVTTYVMPKMVPAASYSTYIIHPMGVTPCGFSAVDSDSAASVQKMEIKTDVPTVNGLGMENQKMDRKVITSYSMNSQTVNDNAMDGQVMEGHAMKGYVMEGHAMNGYVIDGYEEGDITEAEAKQSAPSQFFTSDKYDNGYENSIGDDDAPYKEWYQNDRERDEYWDKLKKEFDAFYEEQYQKFLRDRHPYEPNWNSEFVPPTSYGFEGDGGKGFSDFQPKMDYVPTFDNPYEKISDDFKPKMPFLIRYEDDDTKEIPEFKPPRPMVTFMHGFEDHDRGFGDSDGMGFKNGLRFNHGDFENGFGLRDKYEPKWR